MKASVGEAELRVGKWGKAVVDEAQTMKGFLSHDKEQESSAQWRVLYR